MTQPPSVPSAKFPESVFSPSREPMQFGQQAYMSVMAKNPVSGGGITDITGAIAIARRVFENYDPGKSGFLDNYALSSMIQDTYKIINKPVVPNKSDIDNQQKVLDFDMDGKVSLKDFEQMAIKLLAGEKMQDRTIFESQSKYTTTTTYL